MPMHRLAPALLLCLTAGAAMAQSGPGLRLQPFVSLGQTVTDGFLPEGGGDRRGEAITTLGAGLRMFGRGGRIEGSLDYSLQGLIHARETGSNALQHRLQAGLKGELVPRHLTVGLQASIAQQPVSALAVQTPDGVVTERNRAQVSTLSLQPVWQASLGGAVDASAALVLSATDTSRAEAGASTSDSANASASLGLQSSGSGRLGWSLSAVRSVVDFDAGRKTEDDRLTAGLSYRPDVDWQLRLRGGVEANDFRQATKERYDSWGAGLEWTPSPRTKVSLDGDRRSFGHSHTIELQHRSRRTVWRYSDGQDVSRGSNDTAQTLIGAYDLFFELLASQEPDPALRAQLVDSLLQRNGLARDSQVALGYLTSSVTLQRRQEASVAIDAQRTTWLLSAYSTRSERVDTVSSAVDDTAGGNTVRQRGLSLTVAHRLTPTGSLSLALSTLRSSDGGGLNSRLRSLSAGWTERVGVRTDFSLAVRHSDYDADLEPYTENAVIANLTLRF